MNQGGDLRWLWFALPACGSILLLAVGLVVAFGAVDHLVTPPAATDFAALVRARLLAGSDKAPAEIITELYLAAFARPPTAAYRLQKFIRAASHLQVSGAHVDIDADRRVASQLNRLGLGLQLAHSEFWITACKHQRG